jgi:hypothetical protein
VYGALQIISLNSGILLDSEGSINSITYSKQYPISVNMQKDAIRDKL